MDRAARVLIAAISTVCVVLLVAVPAIPSEMSVVTFHQVRCRQPSSCSNPPPTYSSVQVMQSVSLHYLGFGMEYAGGMYHLHW